jgi:hypothetical protein
MKKRRYMWWLVGREYIVGDACKLELMRFSMAAGEAHVGGLWRSNVDGT